MNRRPLSGSPLERQLRRLADSFLGAMLGALVYAAWAVFANWPAGPKVAFTVGTAHWLASTFLTYTGTAVMRHFFALAIEKRDGALLAFASGLGFTYAVLLAVHHAVATPNLAFTLAAGVVPNLLFCGSYALLLARTAPASTPGGFLKGLSR